MATTFTNRESDVIKWAASPTREFEIDQVTVLVDSNTEIGTVVYNNSGTWTRVNAANVTNAAGIVVDDRLRFGVDEVGGAGNQTLSVLRRNAVAGRTVLEYAADVNSSTLTDQAEAALLTQGIKVVNGA